MRNKTVCMFHGTYSMGCGSKTWTANNRIDLFPPRTPVGRIVFIANTRDDGTMGGWMSQLIWWGAWPTSPFCESWNWYLLNIVRCRYNTVNFRQFSCPCRGQDMRCVLWVQSLINVLLMSSQYHVWYHDILDCISHCNDVIMSAMASQITSLTIIYSTVYSKSRSKETSKPHVTGICAGDSPLAGELPAQMASNEEYVSIWWRHHALKKSFTKSVKRTCLTFSVNTVPYGARASAGTVMVIFVSCIYRVLAVNMRIFLLILWYSFTLWRYISTKGVVYRDRQIGWTRSLTTLDTIWRPSPIFHAWRLLILSSIIDA